MDIYQFVFHKQKIDSCHIKSSFKIWELKVLSKKLIHVELKVCLCFKLLKIFKAIQKNNTQTHSQSQNKKAVLTTADYFCKSVLPTIGSRRQ